MDALATLLTALVASPKQHDRLLRLHTPLGADVLVAETLQGVESVDGGGFRLELTALSVDAGLDLDALLGAPVLLELQTAQSIDAPRPLHGHVTSASCVGSNGGVARYRLVVEPWLAFLRQRVDSYVFHDMTVIDIVEDLFSDYAEAGRLVPAWRWELADRSVYRTRSITTQYAESDFAFLERLLAEEGIALWFEHTAEPGSDTLGAHTLVLGDHVDAFNEVGAVRFHRNDASETADGVQQWSVTRQWQTSTLARASWDYRSRGLRAVSAEGTPFGDTPAEDCDTSGPYAYADAAHGELRARRQMEALQVDACTVDGAGSWRQQAPGTRFVLEDHPAYADADAGRFTCLRVEHDARNNLGAEIDEALERSLGQTDGALLDLPDALSGLTASKPLSLREMGWGEGASDNAAATPPTAFYRNTFRAIPATTPYRPRTEDGHGLRLHPKPTVTGTQSAIVVSDGAPVQTDRDHRIKVQFAWQRGGASSSGRSHPNGDNAPASDAAWTWVRVATPWAGDNWGGVVVPRKGQEVLVAFLEGDVDRPVIVGSVYNGRGQVDAPHNQLGGGNAKATGNAAAWFDGNDHKAVFTGFKSQALKDSQSGSGGYQQLRLDDTPGEGRAQVSTTQHQTTLTLGHLKGGDDNVRGANRGFGAELSTQASGAVRAGQGLLLTTEPGTQQLSAAGARAQLDESEQLLKSLSDTAKTQTAILPGDPDVLPIHESIKTLHDSLDATQSGSPAGDGVGGGDGDAPGWSSPVLLASSPDGVMTVTPKDQIWVSGTQTSLIAGSDLNWTSQAETVIAAANGIVLFTHGSDAPAGKPQQTTGIALHAAQGGVSARAHKNLARVAAQTSITLASTQADIQIAAPSKHLLATAAGAYLKLEGGNIELGAPGKIEFKAAKKDLTGPKSIDLPPMEMPETDFCLQCFLRAAKSGGALVPAGAAAGGGESATNRLADMRGAAGSGKRWTVEELLKTLCPKDKAVVDDLAKTDVMTADKIYYDDPLYDGSKWTTKRFDGGGSWNGQSLLALTKGGPQSAATTIYHELVHKHQPSGMAWQDKEVDAYYKTEGWAIERGYEGQGVPEFRTTGAGGKVVPDRQAITAFVKENYPVPKVAGAPRPIGRDAKGNTLLSDGTSRPPIKGDTYAGKEVTSNLKTVPPSSWKCPGKTNAGKTAAPKQQKN